MQSRLNARVLMTGHLGYIGSVMAPMFQQAGVEVIGLDTGYFSRCTLVPERGSIPSIDKDIRDIKPGDLKGFDAVVHLAALSNDPTGNLNDGWTEDINYKASVKLAEAARDAGVRRLLFSSSCIMYGMSANALTDESTPLNPLTEYARSKAKAESAICGIATDSFSPVFLRNGTVYGLSPRMRFDTVFNSLVGAAITTGFVDIFSDGKPWRPVVHVQDVSRAFLAVLGAKEADIHNHAFNVGCQELNCQILQLANIAAEAVPGSKLKIHARSDADQRTYQTDFSKFARTFPEFRFTWNPVTGGKELVEAFRNVGLTNEEFTDKKFTRLKWLNHLLSAGALDESLRWVSAAKEAVA